jgi:small-conductance mechanosensitive channel
VQKTILDVLEQAPRILKTPPATVEVDTLGPLSTTLTVQAWLQNRDFGAVQSDLKKRVRQALESAHVRAPVPVPAPAVAPWTPEPEKPASGQGDKAN